MLLKTDNLIEMIKEDSLFPRNGYSNATWLLKILSTMDVHSVN